MSEFFNETKVAGGLPGTRPQRLTISGLEGEKLWITKVNGSVSPNFQLMYSMGAKAFVNAFNDRLGKISLTGLYVPENCDGGGGVPPFLAFYKKHNINKRTPVKFTFDKINFKGWVVDLQIGDYQQGGVDGHMFTLSFLGRIGELGGN